MQESVSNDCQCTKALVIPFRHPRMIQARSEEEEKERKRDRKDREQEADRKPAQQSKNLSEKLKQPMHSSGQPSWGRNA